MQFLDSRLFSKNEVYEGVGQGNNDGTLLSSLA